MTQQVISRLRSLIQCQFYFAPIISTEIGPDPAATNIYTLYFEIALSSPIFMYLFDQSPK